MVTRILVLFGLAIALGGVALGANAKSTYNDALSREQVIRAALTGDSPSQAILADVRSLVAAYEAIALKSPASGYADNALWQGGRLALDAYARFGELQDKTYGVRLLRSLAARYPSSRFVKQVPAALASAGQAVGTSLRTETGANSRAETGSRIAVIRRIQRTVMPDAVRVSIELDGEVPFHDERLADPARVFVDLSSARADAELIDRTLRYESDADIVRQVRIGRHPNHTTRVVLDAAGVSSYSVYPLYNPYRLVIECVRQRGLVAAAATSSVMSRSTPIPPVTIPATSIPAAMSPASPIPALPRLPVSSQRPAQPWLKAPAVTPRAAAAIADAQAAARVSEGPESSAPAGPIMAAAPVAPPAPGNRGGFSISRQLGLGVSRIVIDPGHGGHDPGAKGRGVQEAELVLDVALRLEKLLQQISGLEVILTRRTDEFVPLPERTAIANREGADLFLSIHANASPTTEARGVETYFLNFAENLSAAAVAARENAASGQAMGALPDFVKAIALNNKLDESRDFAYTVQRAMVERLRGPNKTLKDLGVKQAPFVVLIGASMPSVLAEISFVTNPQDARLLRGGAYRQRIAEALLNAIRSYQSALRNPTKTAHQ